LPEDRSGAAARDLKLPGLQVAWLPVSAASRIPAIVDGKAQLECGSTTNTAKRREQVSFTIPHFISSARFLVRTESGISRIDDLRGKTVVSTKGTTNIRYLYEQDEQRTLRWKVLEADDHLQAFQLVETGKASAFEMDDVLLFGLRAESSHPDEFKIVGENLSVEPYAIMLPKGDREFKRLVDDEMLCIINSYEIFPLYKRWFGSPIPPKGRNLKLPMPFLLHDSLRFPSDQVPG
jgi:ABC-type amino acid transport substrate-binding protein